ncbi:MAG: hypothetical protein WCL29_05990 [Pseudomonadota bacterium]
MKRPSFQFYPADWRKDPALSTCSLASRGLWIELMCVAHEAEIYGVLSINGGPMSVQQIARTVGEAPAVVAKLLKELSASGVFSVDGGGCVYSRRMVDDERIRNIRADSGKLGGNPKLVSGLVKQNQEQNQPTSDVRFLGLVKQNQEQILTPSSSSSVHPISSSLRSEDIPPLARPKKITFKKWIEEIKAAGEKPISEYKPVFEYAATVGLDPDWIQIAWIKFAARYTKDKNNASKRYIDWRHVFLNAVSGNWFHLWYAKDGAFYLTTVGVQADIETREAA